MTETEFHNELRSLLNRHSKENGSDTPDFILARYLSDCLAAWDAAVSSREKWYGRGPWIVGQPQPRNWPDRAESPADAIETNHTA